METDPTPDDDEKSEPRSVYDREESERILASWPQRYGPRIAVSVLVVAGLALIALFVLVPTEQRGTLIDGVDRLIPSDSAQTLTQSTVGVDVKAGYDAFLVIDGTLIEGLMERSDKDDSLVRDGLNKNLETGVITYTPKKGGLIESLKKGENCMQARVWKLDKRPETGQTITWCFSAT